MTVFGWPELNIFSPFVARVVSEIEAVQGWVEVEVEAEIGAVIQMVR